MNAIYRTITSESAGQHLSLMILCALYFIYFNESIFSAILRFYSHRRDAAVNRHDQSARLRLRSSAGADAGHSYRVTPIVRARPTFGSKSMRSRLGAAASDLLRYIIDFDCRHLRLAAAPTPSAHASGSTGDQSPCLCFARRLSPLSTSPLALPYARRSALLCHWHRRRAYLLID